MVPENAEFGASRCCEANCCAQGPDAPACYRGSWSAGEPAAPHRSIAGNDDESIDCSEYCCAPPLTAEEYHSLNNISILFNNIKDDERSNSMLAEDDAQAFHGQDNAGGQGAINGAEDINYWNSDALTARPHSPNTTNAHANAHAAVRADSCMGRSARQPSSPIISPASSPIQQSTCNYSPVMPNCSPVFKAMKSNSEASPGVARAYSATTSPRDDGIRKGRFVIRPAAEQSTGVSTLQYRRGRFQITEAVDHDAGSAAVSKKLLTILSLQNKQLDILFDMIKNIAGNDKLFQREFTQLSDDVYELTECLKKKINM
ncbi:hypothetical protein PAPHI01_2110 [Pancytospora philotis]|nr:hypothetical protein PAPHI01_2110 [Pancytospora philotis]